jgi:phosphatidate cytidylyltransferase|tara:strand:+ start:115 stop:753 length:639 start_codon:yes stop_codon:yes gene_type:complete
MDKELQKRILSSIIIIPLSLFFIIKGSTFFILFLLILFLISSSEWLNMTEKLEIKLLGIFFLIFSFYSTFYIREDNLMFFLLIVIICVSTDLGGYIFGRLFKGPKLIKISPNKTYSGMLGSFLLSIVISYLLVTKYGHISTINDIYKGNLKFIILIFIVSSISQIGDLIISYFKRVSKIKNTGKIFPGHGGMLDRIDGMIFVFPIIYLLDKF